MKRLRMLLICIVLLLAAVPSARADASAADLTDRCSFDFGTYKNAKKRVLYSRTEDQTFREGASFSLTWDEPLEGARLCLQWSVEPEDVSLLQYDANGELIGEDALKPYPETVSPLLPEARKAVVQGGREKMRLTFAAVYGDGELPDPFHDWQETPDRLDYLLISTHPDDDVLYLGSVIPTYGAERGYVGTVVYVTCQNRIRKSEAENGAWAMGLRFRPVFLGMRDVRRSAPNRLKEQFSYDELLQNVVRVYRRYHPLVVFAQDLDGEYGHWQHQFTAKAAREAFALAADPAYDPESAGQFGTWQVQKLYLHLYPENPILIDAHTPLAFFDGRDAFEVACEAYLKHQTQVKTTDFRVHKDGERHAFNRFGMAEGVVEAGDDVFDNVDETLFADYVPPSPESPAVAHTTPAQTEPPHPTPSPEPGGAEGAEEPSKAYIAPLLRIGCVTVLAAIAVGIAAYFWKKRQNEKRPPEE